MTQEQFETAMLEIQKLTDGWLDGNGKAVTEEAFDAARNGIIRAFGDAPEGSKRLAEGYPHPYATPDGGVLLVWGRDNTDITVTVRPDGTTVMDIIGMAMSYCSEGLYLIRNWYFRRKQ